MLLQGIIRPATLSGTVAVGAIVYLGASGALTCDEPTTATHTVRIVGYVLNSTNNSVLFQPDHNFILLQ